MEGGGRGNKKQYIKHEVRINRTSHDDILKPGIRFDHPTDQGGKLETRDAPDL